MARFCICGCNRELLAKDGLTDYTRLFYSKECYAKDKRCRMNDQRIRDRKRGRCSKCMRSIGR